MADTLFFNGEFLTMTDSPDKVTGLLVRDGKIVYVGDEVEARKLVQEQALEIDLAGKTLLPGFIDSHLHLINMALVKPYVDVSPFTIKTFDEAKKILLNEASKAKPGDWVVGFGYDPSLIDGPSELTLTDLDPIFPNNPVAIMNLSGHLLYVNSKAYLEAGVTKDTPNPSSGRFMKDSSGNLNGVVQEIGAIEFFIKKMPKPTPEQMKTFLSDVAVDIASHGTTAICDVAVGDVAGLEDPKIFQTLSENPKFPLRMVGFFTGPMLSLFKGQPYFKPGFGNDRLRYQKIKFWADGSTQGYTAALTENYLNTDSKGFLNYKTEDLAKLVKEVVDLGWPVSIHCNGDAATAQALDIFEGFLEPGDPGNIRHRIEHCTVVNDSVLDRMKKLNITPSFTIGHVYYWGKAFRDKILGPERASRLDSADFFVNAKLPFSFNSDAFTTPVRPLQYVQTAVTRKMRDSGDVLGPEHCISVSEALKAVTIYPALQLGISNMVGSLEVGKYADFVILDKNPMTEDPDLISQIPVTETWLQGEKFKFTS